MSIYNFPETQYIRKIDADESVKIGSFKVQNSGELAQIKVLFYIQGAISGDEEMTLEIYSDPYCRIKIYESEARLLTEVYDITSITNYDGWYGYLGFTFNNENIYNENTYYLKLSVSNNVYTSNQYISVIYDSVVPIYGSEDNVFRNPISFIIYLYE